MKLKDALFRISHWETWSYQAKYIPISPFWLWYCLRSGSLWFFTPSNPTLTFGGFEGESKKEMYEQLPPGSYPRTIYIPHDQDFSTLEKLIAEQGFQYPFAVKPDVGMMGLLFRRVESIADLAFYHQKMPVDYIVQELIDYPLEVSVFYYRVPGSKKGIISGFLKKEAMQVMGDGKSTLWELIMAYPRVRFRQDELKAKHQDRLSEVIPQDQPYYLSYALNLSRGGKLVSLKSEIDDKLVKVFDDIGDYCGQFFYGRYDVKCASVEDLKQGKNFSILEFNGSGAEPHQVYGDGNNLLQAYKVLLHHWKMLYIISSSNRRQGIRYWQFTRGWKYLKAAKKHFRLLKELDKEIPAV